jgi:hypothetical protein
MRIVPEWERSAQHEREVRLAYERGRDDAFTFPALLCGMLIGAVFVSATVWILW